MANIPTHFKMNSRCFKTGWGGEQQTGGDEWQRVEVNDECFK